MRDSSGAAGRVPSGRMGSGAVGGGAVLAWLASVIRQVSGMPDYKGYAEHVRRFHPGTRVLTEQEYYAEYLHRRYGDGPTRCC